MDIKKVYDLLSDCARAWAADADWFDSMHSPSLSELYRFGHKAICDFIDAARSGDLKTVDDIDELFYTVKFDIWNMYKVYQGDHSTIWQNFGDTHIPHSATRKPRSSLISKSGLVIPKLLIQNSIAAAFTQRSK